MLGFLAAIAAGFATPHLEAPLARPAVKLLGRYITIDAEELRLVSFIIALLIASVVAVLLASGSPFWIVIGTTLGYFATRLVAAAKVAMDNRNAD